jgi:hypothetical protein
LPFFGVTHTLLRVAFDFFLVPEEDAVKQYLATDRTFPTKLKTGVRGERETEIEP